MSSVEQASIDHASQAVQRLVPTRPKGEKQTRMQFRIPSAATNDSAATTTVTTVTATNGISDTCSSGAVEVAADPSQAAAAAVMTSGAVRPVGMHEVVVYRVAMTELPAGAPVLDSVVHTHKSYMATTQEESSSGADGREGRVETEVARIGDEVEHWRASRLRQADASAKSSAGVKAIESEMERRIFRRRVEEQDRALRRMQGMLDNIQRLTGHLRSMTEKETPSGPTYSKEELDAAVEKKVHERQQQLLASSAWLVERHVQGKKEGRICCERDHFLGAQDIALAEEGERRALLARFFDLQAQSAFIADEESFRAAVDAREAAAWEQILNDFAVLPEEAPVEELDEEDEEEEGDYGEPQLEDNEEGEECEMEDGEGPQEEHEEYEELEEHEEHEGHEELEEEEPAPEGAPRYEEVGEEDDDYADEEQPGDDEPPHDEEEEGGEGAAEAATATELHLEAEAVPEPEPEEGALEEEEAADGEPHEESAPVAEEDAA